MRLLRDVGIPLVCILILLLLLLAAVVLFYRQNGLMLPFSGNPEIDGSDSEVTDTSGIKSKTQNYLSRIGGNINDETLPYPSY